MDWIPLGGVCNMAVPRKILLVYYTYVYIPTTLSLISEKSSPPSTSSSLACPLASNHVTLPVTSYHAHNYRSAEWHTHKISTQQLWITVTIFFLVFWSLLMSSVCLLVLWRGNEGHKLNGCRMSIVALSDFPSTVKTTWRWWVFVTWDDTSAIQWEVETT
jgi:hypothetical protein